MGTSLQGKKIKDTYKSIIKVTDNSEAGSTGKQLSDGNGNDLGIYVDTDGVLGVGAAAGAAIDASSKTDAIIVPNGTDAQQPSGQAGMIRYNTDNSKMEYYDTAWKNFAEGDIESVVAGDGLTGGADDGNATVNVVGGDGITVTADDVSLSSSVAGSGLDYTNGVLDVSDNLQVGGNESIGIPSGTTTQRNAITTPNAGMFRFNTTDSQFEGYDGSAWGEIGGSGGATLYVDTFDGNGGSTFDLSQSISSENDTQVYIDGVYQSKNTYSTSGTTITFSEAPATGTDNIEVIHIKAIANTTVADNAITHDKLEDRYTSIEAISTLTGIVSFDCSDGAVFELSGDITGAYTIDLTGYKTGQVITIYPIKGSYTVTLDAQGTSTNTFNKLAESDYDGASSNILQIECVDDSATDPVFFYSVATFASDSTI